MNASLRPILLLSLLVGCDRPVVNDRPGEAQTGSAEVAAPPAPPTTITNRFGMTFRRVDVEPRPAGLGDAGKFGIKFPRQPYYLGQTEITDQQYKDFEKAALERDRDKPSHLRRHYNYPSEWRDAYNLGVELSNIDPDYEYRLPTRDEWAFACMNGYDQDCPGKGFDFAHRNDPGKRPNKFGIDGFLNFDLECGSLPGQFFGLGGEHITPDETACRCAQYGYGSPDGDDGLNELIIARYILTPRAKPE